MTVVIPFFENIPCSLKIASRYPVGGQANPQFASLIREAFDPASYYSVDVDSRGSTVTYFACFVNHQFDHLGPDLEIALGHLGLESWVVKDLDIPLQSFCVVARLDEQVDILLHILRVDL